MKVHRLMPLAFLAAMLASCASHEVVTYAEARQIRPHMTLDEVERITGHKGQRVNGQTVAGAFEESNPGQEVYYWKNKDGSGMSVSFVRGQVAAISEQGLN